MNKSVFFCGVIILDEIRPHQEFRKALRLDEGGPTSRQRIISIGASRNCPQFHLSGPNFSTGRSIWSRTLTLILIVPTSRPAAMAILPDSLLPQQYLADSGTDM